MKNNATNYISKNLLIISILFCAITSKGQNYGNKTHYLVDSLNVKVLANGEKKIIDSALTIYHNSKNDTLKIEAINIIVEESWNDNVWPKYNEWVYNFTIKKLADNSINKKKNRDVKKFLLKNKSGALNNYGVLYFTQGDYVKAVESYLKSLKIKEAINDQKGIASVYNNLGSIHDNKGNSSKALSYYLKSLKIRETLDDKKGLSISLNNVGQIYYNQGDIDKALFYFQKSYNVNSNARNGYAKAAILNNIGTIYHKKNNIPLALKYFKESMEIKEEIGDKKGIIISLNSIGGVYRDQKEYEQALEFFHKSLILSKELNNKEGLSISLNNFGNVYYLKGKFTKAKSFSQESMEIAVNSKKPILIRDAAITLSKINKKESNWKEALKMHELYLIMRDSVSNTESEKDVIRQKATYDLEVKEQEIVLLSSQNEVQKLKIKENRVLMIFFSIALGLALILVFLAVKSYRDKQKINILLQKQSQEKSTMLKEIHHRVKNNLQMVNSLLRLQASEVDDKVVVEMFKEARQRVLSMAKLHEKMYGSDDLLYIDIHDHFKSLIDDLVKSYSLNKNIKLDITVKEVKMGISTLIPLGLMINEFITNSLKYAFVDRNKGKLFVHIKYLENKYYEMIIGDDGVGLKEAMNPSGLGSKLIKIFVKQLEGSIERLDQTGTVFKIILKKIDKV